MIAHNRKKDREMNCKSRICDHSDYQTRKEEIYCGGTSSCIEEKKRDRVRNLTFASVNYVIIWLNARYVFVHSRRMYDIPNPNPNPKPNP